MILIVVEYEKTLLPLLVVVFHFLNPTIDGLAKTTPVDDDSNFGAMISNVVTLHKMQKNELGFSKCLFCGSKDYKDSYILD
jgi:hypothetical protein